MLGRAAVLAQITVLAVANNRVAQMRKVAAKLMLALSGQVVFPRFVRLPAVGREKLLQMVQYEVEQNVPFPIDEIVWNHQFIGDDSSGEQCAMIVAAKIDSVREITDRVVEMGLEPEIVDVAPMALYNCLRFNFRRAAPDWPFRVEGREFSLKVAGTIEGNSGEALAQLAKLGAGVARIGAFSVVEEVRRGELVVLLEEFLALLHHTLGRIL